MKQNHFLISITFLSLVFSACKKDEKKEDEKTDVATCRMLEEANEAGDRTVYRYNAAGRISEIVILNSNRDTIDKRPYTYDGNKVYNSTGTNTLNEKGSVAITTYDFGSGITTRTEYSYNDQGQLISKKYTVPSGSYTELFTWESGNLISIAESGSGKLTQYTYYTDQANIFALTDKLENLTGTQSKNLVKSMKVTDGSTVNSHNYEYEFDEKGRVTKQKFSGFFYTYQWSCN